MTSISLVWVGKGMEIQEAPAVFFFWEDPTPLISIKLYKLSNFKVS